MKIPKEVQDKQKEHKKLHKKDKYYKKTQNARRRLLLGHGVLYHTSKAVSNLTTKKRSKKEPQSKRKKHKYKVEIDNKRPLFE